MGLMYAGNDKKIHAYLGNTAIYRMYKGAERIYPNSGTVTYYVDTNAVYTEDINIDDSCLNPQTFTPTKSGYTFIGWREDTTAISSVLSSKIMDGNDVVLYAVFRQTITLSYNGNNATGGSTAAQTGYRYYNNGNASNPSFTLRANGFTRTNYTFLKWAMGSTGGTQYSAGASVTLTANTTFYSVWKLSTVSIPSQIGNNDWQGDRYTGSSRSGPYDLTNVTSLTFNITAKVRGDSGGDTIVTVGVSSNGTSFTASSAYTVAPNNPNIEPVWGGYNETFTRTVNVSSLSGFYYILHTATIGSYNWSRINSITVN